MQYGSILNADFLTADVSLAGGYDLIFADPPYNFGEAYEAHDDKMSESDFQVFNENWFAKALSVLKPTGSMFVVIPDDMVEIIENLRRAHSLTRVNWIIWHYRFGPHMKNRFIPSHAHVLWMTRLSTREVYFNFEAVMEPTDRATKYFDQRTQFKLHTPAGMRPPFDVWEIARVVGNSRARVKECPNQLPRELVRRCIKAALPAGGRVLDPFLGTGTTGSVCEDLKVKWLGIEKGTKTCEIAAARIRRDAEFDKDHEGEPVVKT